MTNNKRIPRDYKKDLEEYKKQTRSSKYSRNAIIDDYDDSIISSNAKLFYNDNTVEGESGKGFFGTVADNFKNLWRSINYDMDVQDVDLANENLRQSKEEKDDIERIQSYINLIRKRDVLRNKLESTLYTNVKEQLDDLDNFLTVTQQLKLLDDYFMGEGRTHKVIADNMFNGAKVTGSDIDNVFAERIKRGWSNKPNYGWSDLWGPIGFVAGGIEYGLGLISGVAGVAGEIVSGAYGDVKDFAKKYSKDADYNSEQINDYIRNLSSDNDDLLKRLYRGNDVANRPNIDSYLDRYHKEAERDINKNITDLKEAQKDLKDGRLFGIDGVYDYNQVSEEWKKGREDYQNGSFWGAFVHPFYATADIASSLDMMQYQLYAKGADVILRGLTKAIVKKNPWVGTATLAADIAAGVTAAVVSREEETKLEAIGAIGNRVANEAMRNGGNLENILNKIREDGKRMGIDTNAMSVDQLWLLGVALDVQTGDEAFENAKKDAQKGINKLINANNALGIADYAEMLPYMSYFGDVTRGVTMFGERAGNKIFNDMLARKYKTGFTNSVYQASDKRLVEEALSSILGPFDRMIENAAANFMKRDMPRAALFAKHAAKYTAAKAAKLGSTGIQESFEEGVQTLLTNKYNRGEYDDYKKNANMFDLGEFAQNPLLAAEAFLDYIGAVFGNPGVDGEDVRKAMNMGFWSSIIQSGGMHALTNFTGPTEDNFRGFVRQMRDDKVAVRILADELKKLQDNVHIDMFYDRFRKGADWNSMYTALNDLRNMMDTKHLKGETDEQYKQRMQLAHSSFAKKEFIEDDIKLMSAVWSLFSSEDINKFLKEKGINKNDENYRQFLRDGATALMDYHKTSELIGDEVDAILEKQNHNIEIVEKLLDKLVPSEQKLQIIAENGKLAKTIDNLRRMHSQYLVDHPRRQKERYEKWKSEIKDYNDFYRIVGKEAIEGFGIDEDIENAYKEENRALIQAKRIFEGTDTRLKGRRENLLSSAYDKQKKQSFVEGLKNDKSLTAKDREKKRKAFVNNALIRELVRDQFRFEELISPYLSRIFENDEEKAMELINKAYDASDSPIKEKDWVVTRMKMLHQLKKRLSISKALEWAKNQEESLRKIRKLTGLDVDPSKIRGWVDFLEQKLNELLEQEKSHFENDADYEKYFKDYELEFEDEEDFNKLAEALYVNRAILKAQAHVANAYRSLTEAPSVLRDAVFGKNREGETPLDEIVDQYKAVQDRMNSRSEAEDRLGVDDMIDLEDMKKLSKQAAWKLIESKLKDADKRNKIVHRRQEELQQRRIEQVISPEQSQPESPVERSGGDIPISDAEKLLRKDFYHEQQQKKDAAEEIRKRKEKQQKEEKDKEESPEEVEDPQESKPEPIEEDRQGSPESIDDEKSQEEVLEESDPESSENAALNDTRRDDDANDVELTAESTEDIEDNGPDINTENIEDAVEEYLTPQPSDDDITSTDTEVHMPEDIESMDPTQFEEDLITGDVSYNGDVLSDDLQDSVKDEQNDLVKAERGPITIDETKDFDDSELTEDIVGEPGVNLIWQTLFYGYNLSIIPIIKINGETITEFNKKPLRPGQELSKKLTNPDWLKTTKKYYIVTQSQEAANVKNDKDAFTVMMVIEDENASYATFYRTVSEKRISISTTLTGKDGLPMKFHINDRENLANDLLLHNMDTSKILTAIQRLDPKLYKLISALLKEEQTDANKKAYKKLMVDAYRKALDYYAKELFAQNYASLHITNPGAKQKGYNLWNVMTASTIVKDLAETDEEFEHRKALYALQRDQFEFLARKFYSKPNRTIFSGSLIQAEIDKLQDVRNEIIDAYLTKDGNDYVFPAEALMGKVEPLIVSQSNGKINNQKTPGGLPILRTVVDESTSMSEIQDMLEDETLLIGIGKGFRASKTVDGKITRPIVKWGFSTVEDQEPIYEDGGCSGKIYMMVPGINGKPVPVMLSEEKFNVQHRLKENGELEAAVINNSRQVELCIDPLTKELLGGTKSRPSAAEVLLYMILGEVNIPGFIENLKTGTKGNLSDLVALFINADAKTLLGKQPQADNEFLQILASKQLYYGSDVQKVQKKTESGKIITTTESSEGEMYFHIGLKKSVEVQVPDGSGGTKTETRDVFEDLRFTKQQILYTGTETESAELLRQRIVQAIATQMHWNTDNFTFGESASMDASKTVLGRLVEALMVQANENGEFDGMSMQLILDHKVSIMGCPQLSFRIGDFYESPEGATNLRELKFARGSVLAWMFKAGHLKTDLGDTNFKDPFVFGHGVKTKNTDDSAQLRATDLNAPLQTAELKKEEPNTEPVKDGENPLYDPQKEKAIVERLSTIVGYRESGISIPKTVEEAKEKIKKWVDFLLGKDSKNKKFADRIDVEKNDILGMILLSERSSELICDYSEAVDGIGIDEDNEEGLVEWDVKLRDAQIRAAIEKYNSTTNEKVTEDNTEKKVLKNYGNLLKTEQEVIIIYKEKDSGKVKAWVDTISGNMASDKVVNKIKPEDRHYFSKAATGVYSRTKTKGQFEEKKARKWLSDKLGIDQENVIVWDAFKNAHIDSETYGEVNTVVNSLTGELIGKIGLSRQGGASVHYHEAWHYVNLLMLNRAQREALYQAYLDTHFFFKRTKPSNKEIEERMAEEFRKWVLLYEDDSLAGKVRRFFSDVLDFLRLFHKKSAYRNQFKKIIDGDYRQSKVSQENLQYFKKEWKEGAKMVPYYVPGLSEEDRGFEHISNHQEYFNAAQAIARRVILNANITTIKDVKKMNKRVYRKKDGEEGTDIVTEITEWINNSNDMTDDMKNLLRDVMTNEALVKKAIMEAFEELGLTLKIRKLKDLKNKEGGEDGVDPIEDDTDNEFKPDNTWDKFDLAMSKKDNAAQRAKLFMKQIPVLKRVIKKDGSVDYIEERDAFGNRKTYSFSEAWNLIVENLWQCESLDDSDKNGYKPTSLMGIIESLQDSNEFYVSLFRQLNAIAGAEWKSIELRSQIYSTINSNKPLVSYLRINDPLLRKDTSDDLDDASFDDSDIVRNGVVADIERNWEIKNDNEEEVARNLPRDWSRALTAHGLTEIDGSGKTKISKNYAKRIDQKLKDIKKDLSRLEDKNIDKKIDSILDKVIGFYKELAIPLDKDSLYVMMQLSVKGKVTNKKIINELKDWFINQLKNNQEEVLQNTVPKMAEAIITAANNGKDVVKYGGDKRERQLDELFSNFSEGHHIHKLAVAINTVHPSSREFSIKGPNGERIYPVSQNSFVSDRTRKLSTSGKEFAKSMREMSPYHGYSLLLDTAGSYTKPLDKETHFKLNAFVGIKDGSRKKGADYFGITPMEDYIAKMIMTEKDQIILPTMADKKTWYSISHKNLKLVHDSILVMPYKDILHKYVYAEYEKEHERPGEGEPGDNKWKGLAELWFRNLDSQSELKIEINKLATDDYVKQNKGIRILLYSEDTLDRFSKYAASELEALIDYYSEENIDLYVNKRSQQLLENFHGKIFKTEDGQRRLDFSGNGGKFRYFYDVLSFTDSSGRVYNLNLRLQYLWELQRKIEAGVVKDLKEDDPLYPYVGLLAISGKEKLDGFELVRQELNRIKEEHFGNFISREVKDNINATLIALTKHELDKLSAPNSPYKLVKLKNGMYLPEGIPAQLIRPYAKSISKALGEQEVAIATTQGQDEYLMQDALFSLIANYVANSAISVIEFEKVFSGDPAFYKRPTVEKTERVKNKAALPKTGKLGVVYITNNTERAYIFDGKKYNEVKDLSGYGIERISTLMQMNDGSIVELSIIVDDVYDTFSDKIKRLGSTLSPGDEMRLHYTEEELAKYKELSITDYTNMNVEDIRAQSIFADHIHDTFKKQLLIDHIRSVDPSKFKEYCDKKGLNFEQTISKLYSDQKLFDDVYNLYSEVHSRIEKELKQQVDPYDDITVSDAQVFVRPELYRKIRIGLGLWSRDDERAYRIMESDPNGEWLSDKKKYDAVRKLEIFPLKMSYFLNDPEILYKDGDKNKGRVVPMLNKMAVFPLFRFQATSSVGKQLYDRMNKGANELDMISFKSAVKVGATQNGVKMSKNGVPVEDQVCTLDDLFFNDSNKAIDYRKNNKDGQPNVQYGKVINRHVLRAVPVQILSLSNLRMQLNTSSHKDASRNIGTQMFKLAFSNIIDDAEYNGKTGAEIKSDIMRIIKDLTEIGAINIKEEFYTDGKPDPDKIRQRMKVIVENNGLGAAALEIIETGVAASISSRKVFENSITKIVESEVVDIETTGGSAIQQSVFGYVGSNKSVKSQTGAYKINYNNGEELSWDLKDGSMEVLLSINFFKAVMPKEIKELPFTELKLWLIDNDFIKGRKTDGELSNPKPFGVGYRIPTQGLSSMFAFTVADIMPESVGDLIIVPREFTAQTGSDFDVDKLYLATLSYKNGKLRTEEEEGKTKRVLNNLLLQHYIDLITDPKNYANARASIDVLTNKLKKDFVKGVIRSRESGYIPSMWELTPSFQVDRKREFSIGKDGIAPFALNVTNLSLTQMCHLTMRYDGVISDYEFGALDLIYGKDGRRIADWLSAMVNAHVDVAKDPYIFDLNVNHATYNYANFLLRAGMGMSTFTFLAQQSLKNIADEINNASGIYGGNIDGSKPESEIYKKRKSQAILNEFANIKFRLISLRNDYNSLKTKNVPQSQIDKLNELISYAEYMSLSDYLKRNRYKDKDVPELKYERKKVFNEDAGILAIENGRSSDLSKLIDYYEFLLASVRCFKEIANHAQGISSLVSASLIDTKKFGNTIKEHINFRNKIDHMYEDYGVFWTINEEGFDLLFLNLKGNVDKAAAQKEAMRRYFEDSYLEDKFTKATQLIKDICGLQLLSGTQQFEDIFTEIFCQINGRRTQSGIYEKELSADKIESMGDAIDNVMRFNALFNVGSRMLERLDEGTYDFTLGKNKQAVIEKWRELLFGSETKDPLYKRLDNLKRNLLNKEKASEYYDVLDEQGNLHNDLLDILSSQAPNQKTSVGRITLVLSLMDKDSQAKRKLISSFAQLLSSNNDEVREIAEDLMFYAYYSQYDQNTANSFFDLVPIPYRKQYDEALKEAIIGLNAPDEDTKSEFENDIYDDEGVNKIIDVICRNYWFDDLIVPRYFIKDGKQTFQGNLVNGHNERYGEEYGFPRFIAFTQDNAVKGNRYFKIKIGKDTLLYRKIGEIKRVERKDGKAARSLSVYVPIPKAGLHLNGTHQFEFYADYYTPSVFKENRITSNFAHDSIREEIQQMLDKSNNVKDARYQCDVLWDDEIVPEIYNKLNRDTYNPISGSESEETAGKVVLYRPREYADGKFIDPEQAGIKAANVVIDISSDGKSSILYKDDEHKSGINEEYKDKVVAINPTKAVSDELYNKIKRLLSDEETSVRRIYIRVSKKYAIPVSTEDVDAYLKMIGVDSKSALRLLENTNALQYAVRQYKINIALNNIMSKLKSDGINGIILDCGFYGDTSAPEAIQFCKLNDNDISAKVHMSFFARYKKPKVFGILKKVLNHRKEDFAVQNPSDFATIVEEAAKKLDEQDKKTKDMVDSVINENEGFDLSSKLKPKNLSARVDDSESKPTSSLVSKIENNPTDKPQNKNCGGEESNDLFD